MADEKDINNPDGVVGEGEGQTPQESPDQNQDQPDGTDGEKSNQDKNQEGEDFIPEDARETFKDALEKYPDLAAAYKGMQGHFTREMQKVPKEFRDAKVLDELKKKSGMADRINSDPRLLALIDDYYKGGKKREDKQDTPKEDPLKSFMETLTEDEKVHVERFRPLWEGLIKNATAPLHQNLETVQEKEARAEIMAKYTKLYPDVDIEGSWDDIKDIKKEHPTFSYEDALVYLLGQQGPEFYRDMGKEEGKKEVVLNLKGKKDKSFVIGGSKPSDSKTYTPSELAHMSPEQYKDAVGLSTRED